MAIADMSPAHQDRVGTALKSPQDVVRRHGGRTHDTDGPDIGRILQTAHPRQIRCAIGTPVAHKSNDFRLEIILFHLTLLLDGLKAQRTLDLGVQLIVVKSHQGRCLGGTGCRAGAAAFAKGRIHFSHKSFSVEVNGIKGTDINASQASGTKLFSDIRDYAAQLDFFFGQNRDGSGGSGLSLGNRFIDGFGRMGQPADEDTVCGKINRSEFDMGFCEKAVLIQGDLIKPG